ncbi:MAG: hypothetical protein AAF802_20070 [Planctomycetota bacterium]
MNPPLQTLIVTPGWSVGYHQFLAVDPPSHSTEDVIPWWFKEDLFQARHDRFDRLIDLGWYPEFDFSDGEFGLVLYAGDFHGKLLRELRSRCRQTVVNAMNEWFNDVTIGNT